MQHLGGKYARQRAQQMQKPGARNDLGLVQGQQRRGQGGETCVGREAIRGRKGSDQGELHLPWKEFGFYFELLNIINILKSFPV